MWLEYQVKKPTHAIEETGNSFRPKFPKTNHLFLICVILFVLNILFSCQLFYQILLTSAANSAKLETIEKQVDELNYLIRRPTPSSSTPVSETSELDTSPLIEDENTTPFQLPSTSNEKLTSTPSYKPANPVSILNEITQRNAYNCSQICEEPLVFKAVVVHRTTTFSAYGKLNMTNAKQSVAFQVLKELYPSHALRVHPISDTWLVEVPECKEIWFTLDEVNNKCYDLI